MKKKGFDCVALQHEGAIKIYEETKGMTAKQRLAYWKRTAAALTPATKTARKGRRSRKAAAR
jgi:hypothetical protein